MVEVLGHRKDKVQSRELKHCQPQSNQGRCGAPSFATIDVALKPPREKLDIKGLFGIYLFCWNWKLLLKIL